MAGKRKPKVKKAAKEGPGHFNVVAKPSASGGRKMPRMARIAKMEKGDGRV